MAKGKPHKLTGTFLKWRYCIKYGTIAIRNKPTQKELNKPCQGADE